MPLSTMLSLPLGACNAGGRHTAPKSHAHRARSNLCVRTRAAMPPEQQAAMEEAMKVGDLASHKRP